MSRRNIFNTVGWMILILPFLKPSGLAYISRPISSLYNLAICADFVLLALLLMLKKDKKGIFFFLMNAAFFGWICLITLLNKGNLTSFLLTSASCLGLVCIVALKYNDPVMLFNAFRLDLEALICINFGLTLIYPNGMYVTSSGNWQNWLLGYDNHWFIIYYVAYGIEVVCSLISGKYTRLGIMAAILMLSSIRQESGVLIIGVGIITLFFVTNLYKKGRFSYKNCCFVGLAISILLIFIFNLSFVTYFIDNVMNKMKSFSARQSIWGITLDSISSHLLLGRGYLSTKIRISEYRNPHGVNAHNMWLEILFEGGLVAAVLFSLILICIGKKIKKNSESKQVTHKAILLPFFAAMVCSSVDAFLEIRGALFFCILAILYLVDFNRLDLLVVDKKRKGKLCQNRNH